jgi:hypothetical protein
VANLNDKEPIKPKCLDEGIHLYGSILCLDTLTTGQVSFLSSAATATRLSPPTSSGPQLIATEETIRLLESKKQHSNALLCQYNRPFSIGRLRMELLPSGAILGGASLYIESGKNRILYAPQILPQKNIMARQMQLKKASTLILGAFSADNASTVPNRKKEKDRLIQVTQAAVAQGKYPVIFCEELATAQEITKELSDVKIPVAVHNKIYRFNQVYEQFGAKIGSYSLFHPKRTKNKVLILPMVKSSAGFVRFKLPDGPLYYVECSSSIESPGPSVSKNITERFFLNSTADGKELREVIQAVGPKEIYFFGPYAKKYCEDLKHSAPKVRALFPNGETPLF